MKTIMGFEPGEAEKSIRTLYYNDNRYHILISSLPLFEIIGEAFFSKEPAFEMLYGPRSLQKWKNARNLIENNGQLRVSIFR